MSGQTRTQRIAADAASVWAMLADFGGISAWAPNVDHSCLLTEQAGGTGAVRRIQSGRTTVLERVTHWEPGVSLAYSIEGLPPVVRAVSNRWSIALDGAGSRVSLTTSIEPGPRPPHKLIARVVARRLAQVSDEMLAGLGRALEQETRAT